MAFWKTDLCTDALVAVKTECSSHLSLCRMGVLLKRLQRSNLTEVSYMIVNKREAHSRAMYWELKRRAPPSVPVYQQDPFQEDVWETLGGDTDDFLVYDR